MIPATQNGNVPVGSSGAAEDTLRLIANLPAPAGLEDRIKAKLESAPRSGRVLFWPSTRGDDGWRRGSAVRAVAAAAIVFVVAGGGWGVYSRVQPPQQTKLIAMPPRANGGGGFSAGGAMRTPQTLNGPVLVHPLAEVPVQTNHSPAEGRSQKKPRHAKPALRTTPAVESAAR